ncbi:hypothetical protein [Rufibacter latericius]|uniref:Uncharacterized protein n=1 Tax=Rufibacter latericius TaxID=2487040 RepID=A0A3M9N355_9BACT|nr:hypothetical protein [Rufibacter latericius]RNI31603.1 hypothetical protein EFB08_03565 [Rufibacter latericius]
MQHINKNLIADLTYINLSNIFNSESMSDITAAEKQKLEKLLRMNQGFLLNFTDNALQLFITKSVGIDLMDEKYKVGTGSKANRMRGIWAQENNFVVAKLIYDLCRYWQELNTRKRKQSTASEEGQDLLKECLNISKRLVNSIETGLLVPSKKREYKNAVTNNVQEQPAPTSQHL